MQDMYPNSNEGMIMKLIISVGHRGEKKPQKAHPD